MERYMKMINVRGADGKTHTLAFVRERCGTVYACPPNRYDEAASGNDDAVVGFPAEDVTPALKGAASAH